MADTPTIAARFTLAWRPVYDGDTLFTQSAVDSMIGQDLNVHDSRGRRPARVVAAWIANEWVHIEIEETT